MMKYQLVLQFPGQSIEDYDMLVALEDDLAEAVAGQADVDGHDFGSGEMNIFIFTDSPADTFSAIRGILDSKGLLGQLRVACRDVDGEEYTVLWPEDFTGTFDVI